MNCEKQTLLVGPVVTSDWVSSLTPHVTHRYKKYLFKYQYYKRKPRALLNIDHL